MTKKRAKQRPNIPDVIETELHKIAVAELRHGARDEKVSGSSNMGKEELIERALLPENQRSSRRRLGKLKVGDTVQVPGAVYTVTTAVRRHHMVLLELEVRDGEHATLIGAAGTPLPFGVRATLPVTTPQSSASWNAGPAWRNPTSPLGAGPSAVT